MERHVVIKKLNRAAVAVLATAGLTFTGLAPANAISGGGFQTSDLGKNGTAVATLAIPMGDGTLNYRTCAGVLIKPNEVLTTSECFSNSNDPYKAVFGRDASQTTERLATQTARVTFGNSATDNTNAENRVYFSVRVETPANTAWGLSVVQLDRNVSGVTPVTKAPGVVQDGQSVNLVGWESSNFVPSPGAIPATVAARDKEIAYRVMKSQYETSPQSWETFLAVNKAVPKLDMPSVTDSNAIVPAFKINGWRTAKEATKELGSPVITSDGKLQGLLAGYDKSGIPVFLDAGQADISDWIYRAHTPQVLAKKSQAIDYADLVTQYKGLRSMLCSKPNENAVTTFESFAKEATTATVNTINTLNNYVDSLQVDPSYKYRVGNEQVWAPDYGSLGLEDPKLLTNISTDPDTIAGICNSQPGVDLLDLSSIYDRAQALRGSESLTLDSPECASGAAATTYQCERLKVAVKVRDAEDAKKAAERAWEEAKSAEEQARLMSAAANYANPELKQAYDEARAFTKQKQAELDQALKAYLLQEDLNDQVVKNIDPLVGDAVNAVSNGLLEMADKVRAAQGAWDKEDEAFRKNFMKDMDTFLKEKTKAANNASIRKAYAENNCAVQADGKTVLCENGYVPEKEETVNQSILDNDPVMSYLTKGGGKDTIKRDMKAYYESLNEGVPIMLEARYQLWNLQRMVDLLASGQSLDDNDEIRDQIIENLKKVDGLKNQISTAFGDMQRNGTDLEKLFSSLTQGQQKLLKDRGYDKAIQDFNNAKVGYQGAETDLRNLNQVTEELPEASTSAELNSLLDKSTTSLANLQNILNSLVSASEAMKDLLSYGELAKQGLVNTDDPTIGMTEKEKAAYEKKKAAEEAKAKKEAEKAAAAAKKAAEKAAADAKKAAEKAAKDAEKEFKKDAKRLEKALSKKTLRAGGANRVLTSIAAWKMGDFPGDSIVLADGNTHADGLAATPFAAALQAPLLLTQWKSGLEPWLMDQIKASGKRNLYLIGNKIPMTPYDAFELRDAGVTIHRIGSGDKFSTSVAVNRATEPLIGAAPRKPLELFLADGIDFPDGLVAGSTAGRKGALMLLTNGDRIDPQTYNYIIGLGKTRPLTITAVGGPATRAVRSTPWPTTFGVNIKTIMGKDRYETAAKLAASQPGTTSAVLVTGENFADALSAGPLAAEQNAAVLLSRAKTLPEVSLQAIRRHGAQRTIIVGGEAAVGPEVAEQINGEDLDEEDLKSVSGTLAEAVQLEAQSAAQKEKARTDALAVVKDSLRDADAAQVKNILSELGLLDILTKMYQAQTQPQQAATVTA